MQITTEQLFAEAGTMAFELRLKDQAITQLQAQVARLQAQLAQLEGQQAVQESGKDRKPEAAPGHQNGHARRNPAPPQPPAVVTP
jgi:hypothetical protein